MLFGKTGTAGEQNRRPFSFGESWLSKQRNQFDLNEDVLVRGLRKMLREPKRVRRGAVFLIVFEALPPFRNRRNVAGRDPPQAVDGLVHFFEPLGAVTQQAGVLGFVSIIAQCLKRFPNRHVQQDGRVSLIVEDVRGVAGSGLQPPHEAGSVVGQRVDRVELSDKLGNLGIVDGGDETTNVDLSQMVVHGGLLDASPMPTVTSRIHRTAVVPTLAPEGLRSSPDSLGVAQRGEHGLVFLST